jgi:hypothetical protein
MQTRPCLYLAALLAVLATAPTSAVELRQASWVEGTTSYRFGHESIPVIPVRGAPEDTDWDRWAMLHDGQDFRLYAFRQGRDDALYQFAYDGSLNAYVWGHRSIPEVTIADAPATADTARFAMLHDGYGFRLLLGDRQDPTILHQFGFDLPEGRYVLGLDVQPRLPLVGFPPDVGSLAALHDGTDPRLFLFAPGTRDVLLQGAFDERTRSAAWGQRSMPRMFLEGLPSDAEPGDAAMLHDGSRYRLYLLVR